MCVCIVWPWMCVSESESVCVCVCCMHIKISLNVATVGSSIVCRNLIVVAASRRLLRTQEQYTHLHTHTAAECVCECVCVYATHREKCAKCQQRNNNAHLMTSGKLFHLMYATQKEMPSSWARERESDRKRASIAAVMQCLIKKVACSTRYQLISNKVQLHSRAQNLTVFRQEWNPFFLNMVNTATVKRSVWVLANWERLITIAAA